MRPRSDLCPVDDEVVAYILAANSRSLAPCSWDSVRFLILTIAKMCFKLSKYCSLTWQWNKLQYKVIMMPYVTPNSPSTQPSAAQLVEPDSSWELECQELLSQRGFADPLRRSPARTHTGTWVPLSSSCGTAITSDASGPSLSRG